MAELAQERGRPEEDVDPVDARLDGHPRVVHVAADVREHLRLQRERGDGAAVLERLWRSDRRGQLDVLDPELVEELGHRDLLGGREVRVRELLALAEGRVDDRKTLDRHGYPPTHAGRPPGSSEK